MIQIAKKQFSDQVRARFGHLPILTSPADVLSRAERDDGRIFILGRSGSGKSWLLDQVGGFDLDRIGYLRRGPQPDGAEGDEWVVNPNDVPANQILGGTANNMADVISEVKPQTVIFVITDPDVMKPILRAKADDYVGTADFKTDWLEKASLPAAALIKHQIDATIAMMHHLQLAVRVCVYINTFTLPPGKLKGWHSSAH